MTTGAEDLLAVLEHNGLPTSAMHGAEAGRRWARASLFNGAADVQPCVTIACDDEAVVAAALRVARDRGESVSVLGGGHNLDGQACAGSLVLDLRRMSQVHVDRAASEVTVGGGTLTRDLLAALPDDLVTATGTITSVGVTGLTLGGGYGRLTSRVGLASDCVTRARVVLADGSAVAASASENADLFWALRGGGSGFGAVTSLTLALHVLPRIWSASILLPLSEARGALLLAQELLDRHPIELSLFMGFMTGPTGQPVMVIAPVWSGDPGWSDTLLRHLSVQGSFVLQQGWMPYKASFDEEGEKAWPKGRHYHILTRTLRRLDERAAEILVEAAQRMTSPHSAIVIHDFHGVPTYMPPDATAFPLRDDHFVVESISAWNGDSSDDGTRHRAWAEDLSTRLASIALPGGYVNLLAPSDHDRVRLFYGPAAERLRTIKRRVDPDDLFRFGIGRLSS